MKVAIYSPYLDTFGGGEKYMMTVAQVLAFDNTVEVLLDKHLENLGGVYLKSELSKRFNLNLERVKFIKAPVGEDSSSLARAFFLRKYDLLFYLTDGSIFYPTSKRNILHIQSPLIGQPSKNFWGRLKLQGWDLIIYNSRFTKEHSERNWPIKSEIIFPPVDTDRIKPLEKKKYILSVGRFFGYLKDKKHKILIKTFRELFETGSINGWSLHLVGSAGKGDMDYLNELRVLAKGLPVTFYPNLDYGKLIKLYGQSSIYWHAAGFGETDPTKVEHFGISTVEAMAGGCVPAVIGKGGQIEIIENGKSGYLWQTLNELQELTLILMKDDNLRQQMARESTQKARDFSKENFQNKMLKIIKD